MTKFNQTKSKLRNVLEMKTNTGEQGRSMVEMLGVLAVVGVLSVGAISGYRYAMNKYRANQLVNDVNMRLNDIKMQIETGKPIDLSQWSDQSTAGYTFEKTNVSEAKVFLSIEGLSQKVCQLVKESQLPYKILINDSETECGSESNTLSFIIEDETILGKTEISDESENATCTTDTDCRAILGKPVCSSGSCVACPSATPQWNGSFCEACLTGQIFNEALSTCVCPEGERWNVSTNQCETSSSCAQAMINAGFTDTSKYSVSGNTITWTGSDFRITGKVVDLKGCDFVAEGWMTVENSDSKFYAKSLTNPDGLNIFYGAQVYVDTLNANVNMGSENSKIHVAEALVSNSITIFDGACIQASSISTEDIKAFNSAVINVSGDVSSSWVSLYFWDVYGTYPGHAILKAGGTLRSGWIDIKDNGELNVGQLDTAALTKYTCGPEAICKPEPASVGFGVTE